MQKYTGLILSGAALLGSLFLFVSTGGFTAGITLQEIRGDVRLLRHELIAANALQDAQIANLREEIKALERPPK